MRRWTIVPPTRPGDAGWVPLLPQRELYIGTGGIYNYRGDGYMTFADFVVAAVSLAAIVWVNWYFLISGRRRPAAKAQTVDGVQEVQVIVRGGYEPRSIAVDRGRPV